MRAPLVLLGPGLLIDGKYRILREIGAGAWAQVFEGVHERLERPVAIKVLGEKLAGASDVLSRFEQEGRAATRIQSRHVVDVFDVGTLPDGRPFLVMELLEGRDLGEILDEDNRLKPERAVELVRQAARGLAEVHAAGVLHRDIKPDNLFVVRDRADRETIKIIDLGISKLGDDHAPATRLTATNMVVGSPLYMSPEQCRGAKDMDDRSDIYSLGVVLYELLTGDLPFDAASFNELMFKVALEEPPSPQSIIPELDDELCAIVKRALQREREARYQSADELADDLEAWQRSHGVAPGADSLGTSPTARPPAGEGPRSSGRLGGGTVLDAPPPSSRSALTDSTGAAAAPAARPRRWPIAAAFVVLVAAVLALGIERVVGRGPATPLEARRETTAKTEDPSSVDASVSVGVSSRRTGESPREVASATASAVATGSTVRSTPRVRPPTGEPTTTPSSPSTETPTAATGSAPRAVVEGRTIRTDL